jgi:hypothetical protein
MTDKSEKFGIKDLLSSLISNLYGTSRETSMKNHTCVKCKKDAIQFRDTTSVDEYTLSGWCQNCQDNFFGK